MVGWRQGLLEEGLGHSLWSAAPWRRASATHSPCLAAPWRRASVALPHLVSPSSLADTKGASKFQQTQVQVSSPGLPSCPPPETGWFQFHAQESLLPRATLHSVCRSTPKGPRRSGSYFRCHFRMNWCYSWGPTWFPPDRTAIRAAARPSAMPGLMSQLVVPLP